MMMKTADETKRGLEYLRTTDVAERLERFKMGLPYAFTEEIAADALELIQQLEAQAPRWISVEERLPEEGQQVAFIPSCKHGSVYVGVLSKIGKSGGVMFSHREGRYKSNYYAKYWLPLPEPPKD